MPMRYDIQVWCEKRSHYDAGALFVYSEAEFPNNQKKERIHNMCHNLRPWDYNPVLCITIQQ